MAKRRMQKDQRPKSGKRSPESPKSGDTWLYGRHAGLAALANPRRRVSRILVQNNDSDLEAQVAEAVEAAGTQRPSPEIKDRGELDALAGPDARHQGLGVCVMPLEPVAIEDIMRQTADQAQAVIVVLDQATDPRNIGAVLRSAAAFDAAAVIVQDRHTPAETGTMAKAASGASEIVPLVHVTNIARALEQLAEAGYWSVGLDGYADQPLSSVDTAGKCVLVMGAEGSGLRRLVRDACDHLAKIPISPKMESLNLSNATAIALYEVWRSRG